MPSKTAARSRAKTSRSKAGSRQAAAPGSPEEADQTRTRRRIRPWSPPPVRGSVGRPGDLADGRPGSRRPARSVGHARDIDPGHRRDGIALTLMGIAVVIAAGSWFDAARPVGEWIDGALRMLIGSAVMLLPIVAGRDRGGVDAVGPDPDSRPRLILGATMIALPVLGLWHLWAGSPTTPAARQHAAGFIGFAIGGPLSDGADGVDRRAPAVYRRAVRFAAAVRHDRPRGAGDPSAMFGARMFRRAIRRRR